MDNRKNLLLLVSFWSICRKKQFISKRRRLLKLMILIKWHLIQSSFVEQISFQLPNSLLLANTQTKSAVTGWQNAINPGLKMSSGWMSLAMKNKIKWVCQKEFRMGLQTFEYFLNMIRPGIEKMEFLNWECLSHYRSLSNSSICFFPISQFYVNLSYQPTL